MARPDHYHVPGLALVERGPAGRGVIATEAIDAGTVVVAYGGQVVDATTFAAMSSYQHTYSLQIAERLFMVIRDEPALGDYINHSCDPNLGLMGATMLVAMRRIPAGTEITFDYAMTDGDPYDEFECRCGSELCRNKVTGSDWMLPELWERYDGFFSPFIKARIDDLRQLWSSPDGPAPHT